MISEDFEDLINWVNECIWQRLHSVDMASRTSGGGGGKAERRHSVLPPNHLWDSRTKSAYLVFILEGGLVVSSKISRKNGKIGLVVWQQLCFGSMCANVRASAVGGLAPPAKVAVQTAVRPDIQEF